MDRPTCSTCPYWDRIDDSSDPEQNEHWRNCNPGDGSGECRRHAPRPMERAAQIEPTAENSFYIDLDKGTVAWPVTIVCHAVAEIGWCSEHPDFPAYLESLRKAKSKPASRVKTRRKKSS